MASKVTFSNLTYAGEHFLETFGPTVLDPAGLIDNDLAIALDQTKFKMTLNELDDTVELQDPSAKFNDQSSTPDIDEVNVEAVPYEVHRELAWDNIRKSWLNNQLRPGSLEDYSPEQVTEDFITNVYMPKFVQAQSNLILKGKNGLDPTIGSYSFGQSYNGLYELFDTSNVVRKLAITQDQITVASVGSAADPTVLVAAGNFTNTLYPGNYVSIRNAAGTGWSALNTDIRILAVEKSGSDTNITLDIDTSGLTDTNYTADSAVIRFINRTNIISKMAAHLGFVPDQVRRNGAKIVLPTHLEMEWQFANAEAQQNGGGYYLTSHQLQMIDQKVVILDNARENTIGTWPKNRVGFAFDLNNDATNMELTWLGQSTGDKVYHLRAASKTGIQISTLFGNEITLTTPEKD